MNRQILIVGPVPPPRHGAATINECMARECEKRGLPARILGTTGRVSAHIRSGRANRLPVIGIVLATLSRAMWGAASSAYVSVSGGLGILYECLFALLVRIHGKRLVLHHHSYRYLNRSSLPAWCLARVAGPKATHVCLSEDMEGLLKKRYHVEKTLRLSNAAFLSPEEKPRSVGLAKEHQMVIGLLSNLCPEKGLDDYLAVYRISAARGYPWKFRLAGPFMTKESKAFYGPLIKGARDLDYVGAIYGADKADFFKSLDVFLFPTRYLDEAEPLVILEAMRQGVPCIAFCRGSIPELLKKGGIVVGLSDDFVSISLEKIMEWALYPARRARVSRHAKARFNELRAESAASFDKLFQILSAPG